MSSLKLPRITNVWSRVAEAEAGGFNTRVVIESTGVISCDILRQGDDIVLEISGAALNLPEGLIEVNDGLLREITLEQTSPGTARVEIHLDHPARCKMEVTESIPVRTNLYIDRDYLTELLRGKIIVIDPGHGGEDQGGKGPVNLLEKNVVMPIAQNLVKLFEQNGARPILTRKKDRSIPPAKRYKQAQKEQADLFISIHTHSHQEREVGGTAVLYAPSCPLSLKAAGQVKNELVRKLKLADRGLQEKPEFAALAGIPALEVEVVTITNWVEEGLLRSPTFHKKAAQGIFNGVKNYFAHNGFL